MAEAVGIAIAEKLAEKAISTMMTKGEQGKGGKKKKKKPNAAKAPAPKLEKEMLKAEEKAEGVRTRAATRGVPIPVRVGHRLRQPKMNVRTTKHKGEDALRITGSDFWGVLSTWTSGQYQPMFSMPLTPMAVLNTRVQIEATLWTKFRYHFLEMEFIPVQGTGVNGAALMTGTCDPELPVPGAEGSLQYASALMSAKGAVITPYYMETKFRLTPPDGPEEYYIQPDEQNVDRLTHQGRVLCIQMTSDSPGIVGFLYAHYDITFYGKVLSVNPNTLQSHPINVTSTSNATMQLWDQGILQPLTFIPATGETAFTTSTLYLCYMNCDRGNYYAMTLFWWKTPATFNSSNSTGLYTTPFDAQNQTTENRYRGQVTGGNLPTNAALFYIVSTADPYEQKRHEDLLREQMMAKYDSQANNNAYSSQKPFNRSKS